MQSERQRRIRWAVEECISDLVAGQFGEIGRPDRGRARAVLLLREHKAQLLEPAPQLYEALELPREFSQSISIDVPVPTTSGKEFVVTVRATLMDTDPSWERWLATVLRARPATAEPSLADLKARTAELLDAARERRLVDSRAVVPLPAAPARPQEVTDAVAMREAAQVLADGDEQLTETIVSHSVPSVRLRPGAAEEHRSRFGGVPFLPTGATWPRRRSGRPLHFIAQLDLREVPRTATTAVLPEDGVLAFFYDAEQQPWGIDLLDADGFAVVFVPPSAELHALDPPADTHDDFLRPVAGVRFEIEGTLCPYDLPVSEAEQEAVAGRMEADEPCHRLLGEPEEIQGDPRENVLPQARGDAWRLLLQVDSGAPLDFEFGDSGRIYFLLRDADLVAGQWERCWLVLQCY